MMNRTDATQELIKHERIREGQEIGGQEVVCVTDNET